MNEDLRKMLEAAREASRGLNRCQEADINRLLGERKNTTTP